MGVSELDFSRKMSHGLFIAAGGFEKRALSFARRADVRKCLVERAILIRYVTQEEDNEANFQRLMTRVRKLTENVEVIDIDIDMPDRFLKDLSGKVSSVLKFLNNRSVLIDISGMAHILICCCLRVADVHQLKTLVVYTESEDYYPREQEWKIIIQAVKNRDFGIMAKYLQTAGLKDIQIPTGFKGNTRPGSKTCLFVMAGYEPNRVQGLADGYAPNAIVVYYGKSPHQRLSGRQTLSKELHQHVFAGWRYKEISDLSTLEIDRVLYVLEKEYEMVRQEYDVAITSQCSKMQTVASYLFWKRHPEVQLVFTTAVRIETKRYSRGEGCTFQYNL